MLDLNAPILPGHSVVGIHLGQPVAEMLLYAPDPVVNTLPPLTVYQFGAVWVWACDRRVDKVGIFEGYTGLR